MTTNFKPLCCRMSLVATNLLHCWARTICCINNNEEKKKPYIIEDYNSTKGGVDTMDQMVATFTCKRKINRWPMAVFCNMIDVSALNVFITFTELFSGCKNEKDSLIFVVGCILKHWEWLLLIHTKSKTQNKTDR